MSRIFPVFENDYCMVLNKPAGLAVQGGKGVGISLDDLLAQTYKPRPLLVHRLDKDTSGLILVAKSKEAAAFFSSLFSGAKGLPSVVKHYLAVVRGIPEQKKGVIRLDIDVHNRQKKAETTYRFVACSNSVYSDTVYDNVDTLNLSLMELELGTGRMHQIRKHLSMIGHPILGDDKYGDFSLNKQLRKTVKLKNLLLHAYQLKIGSCPMLPHGLDVRAPLPEHFDGFFPENVFSTIVV